MLVAATEIAAGFFFDAPDRGISLGGPPLPSPRPGVGNSSALDQIEHHVPRVFRLVIRLHHLPLLNAVTDEAIRSRAISRWMFASSWTRWSQVRALVVVLRHLEQVVAGAADRVSPSWAIASFFSIDRVSVKSVMRSVPL
jgi:hypothetical protein